MPAHKGLMIVVAGRDGPIDLLVQRLGGLSGVASVRHVAAPRPAADIAHADMVIDMMGGLAPAYELAMSALGRGTACVSANPLLVSVHGRVLQAAAQGQQAYFGFEAAGFGVPLRDILSTLPVVRMTFAMNTAANQALARMTYRHETLAQVQAHMALQKADMTDWSGKITQARAMAMHAQWHPAWPSRNACVRNGPERVGVDDIKALRPFGLEMVFGAQVAPGRIYTGPMAVAHDSPLVAGRQEDVLLLDMADGQSLLMAQSGGAMAMVSGVLADVQRFMRSRKVLAAPKHAPDMVAVSRYYVQVPYAMREAVLEQVDTVVQDHKSGDGQWQAVVEGSSFADLRAALEDGAVYPLCGEWEAPAQSGLRLVG